MNWKAYIISTIGLLSLVLSTAFAGNNGPNLIVQEEESTYVMYLKVDQPEDFRSITIEGEIQQNNTIEKIEIEISEDQIPMLQDFVARIHYIPKDFQSASYTLTAVNLIGETVSFPEVNLENEYTNNDLALLNP